MPFVHLLASKPINLIEHDNPHWIDLYASLQPC